MVLIIDTIICGSTLDVLKDMKPESIDCVITSPPYWGLRSYSTNPQVWGGSKDCEHEWLLRDYKMHNGRGDAQQKAKYSLQVPVPDMPMEDNTCQLCNAWRGELGLEPDFNLYIQHLLEIFDEVWRVLKKTGTCWVDIGDTYSNSNNDTAPTKSLCNIPHRFAISMTDHKWIQRNTIIWHKPSCMPSSAKDRFTVDFEYVFFFVKNKKYWFEQQFEGYSDKTIRTGEYNGTSVKDYLGNKVQDASDVKRRVLDSMKKNPNGRNRRTVWQVVDNKSTTWRINPQPFKDAHFAVFPEKLVEPMILAGCPSDGIVLDPFVGSGTTALVAKKLGRHYIGIDLQPDYVAMANKRLAEVL